LTNQGLFARFTRNAGFVLGGRLWFVALWFLATPFILESLGRERFGVWGLLFLLSGYLATLDLGLATSVVRFAAVHVSKEKWDELNDTIAQITRLYLLLGIAWSGVIFISLPFVIGRIGISEIHLDEVRFALLASAATFAFANLISVGTGIINGLQRMDVSNTIMVVASIPQIVLLLLGLNLGYGLYAVVLSTAVYWLLVAIGNKIALARLTPRIRWPDLRVKEPQPGWMRFSAAMQLNNVLSLSQHQIDKILLTLWLGVRSVADFELSFRVANAIRSFPVLMLSPLMPVFAELEARSQWDRLRTLCTRGTATLSFLAFGLAACAIPATPSLVRGWVGPGYETAEVLGQWLLLGFVLNVSTGVGTAATRGAGRASLEILPLLVGLIVHVAASWVLVQQMGAVGVGPAVVLGMAVTVFLFFFRFSGFLQVPFPTLFLKGVVIPLLLAIPPGLTAWLVSNWLESRIEPNRLGYLGAASITMLLGAMVFTSILYYMFRSGRLLRPGDQEGS
jgi:O-antigen/teichoic acid export membrane protein